MTVVGYPAKWEADVVLSDGATVHLRPIRTSDAEQVAELHSRLSAETVYFRFFSPMPRLAPDLLERFVNVDYEDRTALVAELGDHVIAVARYDRLPGGREAEVAFVVEDVHQGRGLGTILLEHLAAIARENGIDRFVAETLPTNRRMLGVFHDAGFGDERIFGDGVVRVSFDINPTEESVRAADARAHVASARSIERLLAPRSIAVIGVGRERGTIGHEIFRNLLTGGFAGPVYPVHPTAFHVASVRAYPSVLEIPDEIDLAIVVVPAAKVLDVVDECAKKRVRGLVVISAGFAEMGPEGAVVERELVERARRNGMRMVGPNCMGVINTASTVRMNATFAPVQPAAGHVAFSSQSGALGIAILEEATRLGLGVSTFVSVGNKADVSGNDLLEYWEDDPNTDVVLLYLESFGNPRRFSRVARRVSRRKPLVAVKSGRTAAGKRGASSHTAALASPDVAVDALFRQAGVIRVDTLEQLFDVARVLAAVPLPHGRRVAIVGNSGGPGILAADACEGAGLQVPELGSATQDALRAFLPAAAAVRNPVDLIASATSGDYERALRIVLDDDGVDAVIAIFTPPLVTRAEDVADAVATVCATATKPVVANFLTAAGPGVSTVPIFGFPESAAIALSRVAEYAEWRERPEGTVPEFADVDADAGRLVVDAALAESPEGVWLDPASAADLLAAYRIPIASTRRVDSADEAVMVAEGLGYPVALKAGSGAIVHKRDVGAVHLGLASARQVEAAFHAMQADLGDTMGGAVVQVMVDPGVETIVGVVLDPSFGPLVMFGTGGTAVELLGDRAFRIVPLTDLDVHELVRSVRGSALLFGYRGSPPVDVAALEDVLLRVGRLVDDLPEIAEMDLNPVIVSPRGAVAVDVKIRLAPWRPRPELVLRRLR